MVGSAVEQGVAGVQVHYHSEEDVSGWRDFFLQNSLSFSNYEQSFSSS